MEVKEVKEVKGVKEVLEVSSEQARAKDDRSECCFPSGSGCLAKVSSLTSVAEGHITSLTSFARPLVASLGEELPMQAELAKVEII